MKWFRLFWERYIAARRPAPVVVKPAPPAAAVPPPAVAPLSITEFARIAEPAGASPRDIVRAVAASLASKVDELGWVGLVDKTGRLDISRAKRAWLIVLRGLVDADAAYVDKALLAYRGVMAHQGADGSFPTQDFGDARKQHYFHRKTIALNEIAQSLHAVKASPFYVGSRMAVIDSLIAQVALSARWCAASGDMAEFFADTDGCANQMLSAIAFLHAAGVLTGDTDLQGMARAKMEWLFANMVSADGVFREQFDKDGVGFDTNYQLFSMKLLACYIMLLPTGLWRDNCIGRLRLGLQRWVQTINAATGMIDDSTSSRTAAGATLQPGKIDTWDNAATGFALHLGHYVAGREGFTVPLDVIAARQIAAGQTFAHAED